MIDGSEAERIGMVDHLVGEDSALDEFEGYLGEYAATNSAGCRASKQMLLDCFDLGWEAFFHKYLVLQNRGRGRARLRRGHGGLPRGPRPALGIARAGVSGLPSFSLRACACREMTRAAA